jgi:NAD(P)-dependent dehydrogenase (short-subunit alcohol dehydrogenase family)
VNTVVPGFVAEEVPSGRYGSADAATAIAASVPLRRMATPADIAAACLFLASSDAAYISGADLLVHGGGEPPGFLAVAHGSLYSPWK